MIVEEHNKTSRLPYLCYSINMKETVLECLKKLEVDGSVEIEGEICTTKKRISEKFGIIFKFFLNSFFRY